MSRRMMVPVPSSRRKWNSYIYIKGVRENNLKNFDVKFPLHVITAVTGVSGSGKSSLVTDILYRALSNKIGSDNRLKPGRFGELGGDISDLSGIELIDQNPIGKSSRSNAVTYLKAYDEIRRLFLNCRHRFRTTSKLPISHSTSTAGDVKNAREKV